MAPCRPPDPMAGTPYCTVHPIRPFSILKFDGTRDQIRKGTPGRARPGLECLQQVVFSDTVLGWTGRPGASVPGSGWLPGLLKGTSNSDQLTLSEPIYIGERNLGAGPAIWLHASRGRLCLVLWSHEPYREYLVAGAIDRGEQSRLLLLHCREKTAVLVSLRKLADRVPRPWSLPSSPVSITPA